MKFTPKNSVKKFQMGGEMAPAEEPQGNMAPEQAPAEAAPQEGQDPMMQLALMFAQGLQNQDCQLLAQGAQIFLQMMQQAAGGAPEEAPGEPVFRKGGILVRRIKK